MIKVLPKSVINKIAAGEVVERPASVVKELVENSIDAGATEIRILIEEFGTKKIQIIDNGSGISKIDFPNLFQKHATSKLSAIEDLNSISSFGFRGEALATISSVSEIKLETKNFDDEFGTSIEIKENKIINEKPSSISVGTSFTINNLFENIPARKKFLKAKSTENKAILDVIYKYVLANPEISFFISIDGSQKNFPKEDLKSRVSKVLNIEQNNLIEIYNDSQIKISGFVVHPKVFLKTRNFQYFFVNNRPISDGIIGKAALDGYDTFLMKHQYAGVVIFINLPPSEVDVNVHPRKTEVRFSNSGEVYKAVRFSINNALVKSLKQETLEKLSESKPKLEAHDDNFISEKEVNFEPTVESQNIDDFEDFLKNPAQVFKKKNNSSNFITKKAIEFNREVSLIESNQNESPNKISVDLVNATQLLNAYIVTANQDGLLIIDQHAASERYFYEKYLNDIKNKKIDSKVILTPEIFEFDDFEIPEIEKHKDLFEKLGFNFEIFGKNEIRILAVPAFIKMDNFEKVFHKICAEILNSGESNNAFDKIYHEISATLACHTAVRFGDKISKTEINQILINLMKCEDPYNCPHGRPIIQDFSRYEIEKKFKRCGI